MVGFVSIPAPSYTAAHVTDQGPNLYDERRHDIAFPNFGGITSVFITTHC